LESTVTLLMILIQMALMAI